MRNSSSNSQKKLRFSATIEVRDVRKLSAKEIRAVWLSSDEITAIREENKVLVCKAKVGLNVETNNETLRGLEHMMEDHHVMERRANAFGVVMCEQGITNNPERIAEAYHVASRNACKLAWLIGQHDSIAPMFSADATTIAIQKQSMLTRASKVTLTRMSSLLSSRWRRSFEDDEKNLISKESQAY